MASIDDADESLGSMASMLGELAAAPGKRARAMLVAGQRVVDKYVVVGEIGHGGMGVVYLARDERLERDVAIKVGIAVSVSSLARAEREAQTLAKLSHPNVVVVYEVGEVDGRLFVAMEYLAGGTARSWLAEDLRTWREIVALYVAAGDGLAAAHAAGIVHRDFKPDNVLIGRDGRPRVADFGVARALDSVDPDAMGPEVAAVPATRLTAPGGAVGTLVYMAPEQHAFATADARADQFGLCVALWEALHGTRPFAGRTHDELRSAIAAGAPRPTTYRAPRHIVDALRRGLEADPAKRWPSVAALVDELRRDPSARRRRIAYGGIAALAIACALVIPVIIRGRADPCAGTAALVDVWNPARQKTIGDAFAAAGGSVVWTGVHARLDAFATEWTAGDRAACRATYVEHTQSAELLDKRTACLQQARARFGIVLDTFASGGKVAIARAPAALDMLPELAPCADAIELGRESPQPADPATREAIAKLEVELSAVDARLTLREPVTVGDAEKLIVAARAIGWGPLVTSALELEGSIAEASGDQHAARVAWQGAVEAGLASASDRETAVAMSDLAWSYGAGGEVDTTLHWAHLTEAMLHRIGDPATLGSRVAGAEAAGYASASQPAESLAAAKRELALALHGNPSPIVSARAHLNLAVNYSRVGDTDGAASELAIALPAAEAAVGSNHPLLLEFLDSAATIEVTRGKPDDAIRDTRRALAIAQQWYGPDDRVMIDPLEILGAALQKRGELAEALAATQRALAVSEHVAPDVEQTAELELNVATALAQRGQLAAARANADKATLTMERTLGKTNPQLATLYVTRGWIARGEGKLDDSARYLQHAVELAASSQGMVDIVNPSVELSYTLVKAHRAAAAVTALAEVAPIVARGTLDPPTAAEFHLAYADALAVVGDRARARTEATTSRAAWATLGDAFSAQLAGAEAWLRAHP